MLCVLAVRFRETYVHAAHMDWHHPFNVDVSFLKDIFHSSSPADLAHTLTNSDSSTFGKLSRRNVIEDEVVRQYRTSYDVLSHSVWECCLVLPDRIEYIQECAQVSA